MNAALSFLIFPLSFLGIGSFILKRFSLKPEKFLSLSFFALISFFTGFIFYSYYWFFAGLLGLLKIETLYAYWGLGVLFFALQFGTIRSFLGSLKEGILQISQAGLLEKILVIEIAAAVILTLVRCGTPFIDGDSLVYHLYLPKQFALQGKIWHVPFSEHAYWPLFAEVSFIPGELIRSLALSKFISFLVYLGFVWLAAVTVYDCKKQLGPALLAALIPAVTPLFFFHAPSTYNDLFFGFFLAASLILWNQSMQIEGSKHFSFIAGLFLGAALASKLVAIYGAVAFLGIFLFDFIKASDKKTVLKCVFVFCLGALVTGAPYYLRSWIEYGNPVFPFAQKIFQTAYGYGLQGAGLLGTGNTQLTVGAGKDILHFFLLPFFLTFRPELFGGDKIGYLFLFLGFLIFCDWRRNMNFFIFCILYAVIWFSLSQYTRYLMPVFGILAAAYGNGFANIKKHFPRAAHAVLIGALLLGAAQVSWAGYHAYKDLFLRPEEDLRRVAQEMNAQIADPNQKVLVIGDGRLYFYDFAAFREKPFRHFTRYPDSVNLEGTVQLLDTAGASFLIYVQGASGEEKAGAFDPSTYFQEVIQAGFYAPVYSTKSGSLEYILLKRKPYF